MTEKAHLKMHLLSDSYECEEEHEINAGQWERIQRVIHGTESMTENTKNAPQDGLAEELDTPRTNAALAREASDPRAVELTCLALECELAALRPRTNAALAREASDPRAVELTCRALERELAALLKEKP